jgi:hypothetical protein
MQAKTGPHGRTPWSVEDIKEILAGEVEDGQVLERLRTADRKGLSPVAFAALKSASTADSLLPLLELLEPPTQEEASRMDLVLELLERIAEGQVQLERRLATIESRLAGTNASSPQPSTRPGKPASAS